MNTDLFSASKWSGLKKESGERPRVDLSEYLVSHQRGRIVKHRKKFVTQRRFRDETF